MSGRPFAEKALRRPLATALCACLLALAFGADALAHRTSLGRAHLRVDGDQVHYRLAVSAHDLAVALGIETDLVTPVPRAAFEAKRGTLEDYLEARLRIAADGQTCRPGPPKLDFANLPDEVDIELVHRCTGPVRRLEVGYLVFLDIDAGHRSIATIDTDGEPQEFLFDAEVTTLALTVDRQVETDRLGRWLRILGFGVEHILKGADHVLFLIALLLVASRFLELVRIVTAFTLAHSLTLGLAWFDVLSLPGRLVESLIALSIGYVAAENIWGRRYRRRWLLAFGFGLVHGLGFYSALSRLDLGGAGVITTLLAFNLGVEAGQLAVVALAFPLLRLAQGRSWYLPAMRTVSAALVAIAGFWFVERALTG